VRRPSAREQVLLALALIAATVFALAFFVFLPMGDERRGLEGEARELTERIKQAEKMYREQAAIEGEITRLRAEGRELFMPGKEIVPSVMRDISQLSSDLGLRLTSIRPDEPESIQNSVRYPLTFRVEADFAHIVRLLYEIEQPPHRLWVEGIEIGPGPRGQAEPSALVHVATYTVRPASEGSDAKS